MIRHLKSTSIHRLDDQTKLFGFLCKLKFDKFVSHLDLQFQTADGKSPIFKKEKKTKWRGSVEGAIYSLCMI